MKPLQQLFNAVGGPGCTYGQEEEYVTADTNARDSRHLIRADTVHGQPQFILLADELLTIQSQSGPEEKVVIARFPADGECRICYAGVRAAQMRCTIEKLRLPSSYPENLGERVFYLFRGQLADLGDQDGGVALEQRVRSGKEHQFRLIVRKLIHVYSGKRIDAEFYADSGDAAGRRFQN